MLFRSADSPYQKLADLAGKKLAVSGLHSQMSVSVQTVFEKAGVDWSKLQVVELPFPSMNDALRARQVDVVAQLDPFTTQLRNSGGRVLSWLYVDSVPGQPIGAWYAKAAWLARNPGVGELFARSMREAIDWMNADPVRARREIAAYTGLDAALVEKMPLNNLDYRIRPAKWQALIDMFVEAGELRQAHRFEEYLTDYIKPDIVR